MKYAVSALAALLLICGCTSAKKEMPKYKVAMGIPEGTNKYKPVPTEHLNLRLISKSDVFAGEKTELVFALANKGVKEITIEEWYSNESDNMVILIQPWLTGMKKPDPSAWIELSFDLKKPGLHYPLTLRPGNQALVSKHLDFVEKIQVSPGKMRRYFVQGKMNLKSLNLSSDIYVIQVFPKIQKGGN